MRRWVEQIFLSIIDILGKHQESIRDLDQRLRKLEGK